MKKKNLLLTTVILAVTLFTLILILIPNKKDKDVYSSEDLFGKEVDSFYENKNATVQLFKRVKHGNDLILETDGVILPKETQQKLANSIIQSKFEKTTPSDSTDYTLYFSTGDSNFYFYLDSVNEIIVIFNSKKLYYYYYKIKDGDDFFDTLEEYTK